jgi:hypothetical protein
MTTKIRIIRPKDHDGKSLVGMWIESFIGKVLDVETQPCDSQNKSDDEVCGKCIGRIKINEEYDYTCCGWSGSLGYEVVGSSPDTFNINDWREVEEDA